MSIRKLENRKAKYEVRVYCGKDDAGKSKVVTRTAMTLNEAKRIEGELTGKVAKNKIAESGLGIVTVKDLLDRWLEESEQADQRGMRNRIDTHFKSLLRLKVTQLTPERIIAWKRKMLTEGWRGEPLSPATVNRSLNALSAACSFAVRLNLLDEHPIIGKKLRAKEKRKPVEVNDMEVVKLLIEEAEEPLKLFLRLALATGRRRGELLALRRRDVGKDAILIHDAVAATKGGVVHRGETKGGTVTRLAIGAKMQVWLREAFEMQEAIAAALEIDLDPNPYLFASTPACDRPYHPDAMTTAFDRLRKRLDVTGVTIKNMRHTAATQMIAEGVRAVAVGERLGHAGGSRITEERYVAYIAPADQVAAEALEKLL